MGSTLISAAYKNEGSFVGYDNFSQFGGTAAALDNNIKASNVSATYIQGDYHNFDINVIPKDINVYFFDGPHSNEDQYNALLYVLPHCADKFIFIVDDWNGSEPKWGTSEALKVAPVKVLHTKIFGDHVDSDHAGYWNGFGVFLLEKV